MNFLELKEICKFIKGCKPSIIYDTYECGFSLFNYRSALNQNKLYVYDEKGVKANEYDILMVIDGASSGKLFLWEKRFCRFKSS